MLSSLISSAKFNIVSPERVAPNLLSNFSPKSKTGLLKFLSRLSSKLLLESSIALNFASFMAIFLIASIFTSSLNLSIY